MADVPTEIFRYLSDDDVPEVLVDSVLSKLREKPNFLRFTQDDWNTLRDKKPNLHHFISTSSYEAAPDDPLAREAVAAALLGLVILNEEIEQVRGEERIIDVLHKELGTTIAQIYAEYHEDV